MTNFDREYPTTFVIIENNSRRKQRGVEHIKIDVYEKGKYAEWMWVNDEGLNHMQTKYGFKSFRNELKDDGSITKKKENFEFWLQTPCFSSEDKEEMLTRLWKEQYGELGELLEQDLIDIRFATPKVGYIITVASSNDLSHIYPVYNHVSNDFKHEGNSVFEKTEINNISNINGSCAILEGDRQFTENCSSIIEILEENGCTTIGLSELYREQKKLVKVAEDNIDNLVIDTTLFNDKVKELVDLFKMLNYSPKRVFFVNESIILPIEGCQFFKVDPRSFDVKEINK